MSPIAALSASATTMSMPGIVIKRVTLSSASAERARSRSITLRSLAEPIELAQVPLDRKPLILRHDLLGKLTPSLSARTDPDAGRTGSGARAGSTE